ncbi:MAG: hypothetical protein FWF96_07465 [Kiritimatiellaeota bacterium]|nr:hypothetical protein [Kiritimatiellota bacterium]
MRSTASTSPTFSISSNLLSRLRDDSAWKPLAEKWEGQKFDGEPIVNFAFPAEHYDDGRIRAVLRAKNAVLSSDDSIWAWGVTVVMYDREGGQEGELEAESCLFERKTQTGYSAGPVSANLNEAKITGVNCFWSLKDSFLRMLSEAKIQSAGNPVAKEKIK